MPACFASTWLADRDPVGAVKMACRAAADYARPLRLLLRAVQAAGKPHHQFAGAPAFSERDMQLCCQPHYLLEASGGQFVPACKQAVRSQQLQSHPSSWQQHNDTSQDTSASCCKSPTLQSYFHISWTQEDAVCRWPYTATGVSSWQTWATTPSTSHAGTPRWAAPSPAQLSTCLAVMLACHHSLIMLACTDLGRVHSLEPWNLCPWDLRL